jgi:hypothetical protein
MAVTCKICGGSVPRSEADRKMHGGFTCRTCLIGDEMPIEVTLVRSSWIAFDEVEGGIEYGETLSKEMRG